MKSRVSVRCVWGVSKLSFVAGLSLGLGCGSGGEEGASSPGAPAPAGASAGPAAPPSPSAAPSPSPAPASPSLVPTRADAPALTPDASAPAGVEGVSVSDACDVLGSVDPCGACVCSECPNELAACLGVPGCAEILLCVGESGCSGRECYCGAAGLTECIGGAADGPCKDVVLAAPGGKAPSLADASGGPASDAALRVSGCAEAAGSCRDACSPSE